MCGVLSQASVSSLKVSALRKQVWLSQGSTLACRAALPPHISSRNILPRLHLNPYFSASCAQAPPPPRSQPQPKAPQAQLSTLLLPQHFACTHGSASITLGGNCFRSHLPFRSNPAARGPSVTISLGAWHGTGADTDRGDDDGRGLRTLWGWKWGERQDLRGKVQRGTSRGEQTLPKGPPNGTGCPGG